MATELDEKNSEAIYDEVNKSEDSFVLCEKAAKLGHVRAMRLLGFKYFHGEGVKADSQKALEWWKKAADAGSIPALYDMGVAYKLGHGVKANPKKSQEYFQKAVDRATELEHLDIDSTVAIASIIDDEFVPGKGPEDSFDMFKAAAVAGHPEAMCVLGNKYFYGIGVQENVKEAFKWWEKAVDAGSVRALFYLGLAYEFGYGVKINAKKAIEFYQKAADKGNTTAKMQLAALYGEGNLVKQDIKKAFELTSKAAEDGNPDALFMLANLYLEGNGCEEDPQKAYSLYAEAAEHGRYDGWVQMGFLLEAKIIVSSKDNYIDFYKKAADAGVATAQTRLGLDQLYGENKNIEMGLMYLKAAAEQGDQVAIENLGLAYIRGEIVERDEEKGIKMLEQASEDGVNTASYDLAELFFHGDVLQQDLEKAKKYAKIAVEQGYDDDTGTIEEILGSDSESLITKIINWFKKI